MAFLVDRVLGGIQAPDDATPEEIEGALAPLRQQQAVAALRQNALAGLGGAIQEMTAPPIQQYPKVSGAAAMAMGPNYQSFRQAQLGQFAQQEAARQTQERNRLAERSQLMELLQQEKDRAQQLSYLSARMANDEKDRALREKIAKQEQDRFDAEAKRDAAGKLDPRTGLVQRYGPDGQLLVERDETAIARLDEMAKQDIARRQALRAASGGGARSATASRENLVWNAKAGGYGTVNNGVWTPLAMAGQNAGNLEEAVYNAAAEWDKKRETMLMRDPSRTEEDVIHVLGARPGISPDAAMYANQAAQQASAYNPYNPANMGRGMAQAAPAPAPAPATRFRPVRIGTEEGYLDVQTNEFYTKEEYAQLNAGR